MSKKLIFFYSKNCQYSKGAYPIALKVSQSKNLPLEEYILEEETQKPIPPEFRPNYWPVLFIVEGPKALEIRGFSTNDSTEETYLTSIDNFDSLHEKRMKGEIQ